MCKIDFQVTSDFPDGASLLASYGADSIAIFRQSTALLEFAPHQVCFFKIFLLWS
jgi:hypothetical protein